MGEDTDASPTKLKTIYELQAKYDFKPIKRFGQNFLTDRNITSKIADAAELKPSDVVIEIGPGLGALTVELAKRVRRVVAVEIDKKMVPALAEVLTGTDNVEIINQDFMDMDLASIHGGEGLKADKSSIKVVGNLPYYITTPIIMKVLEGRVRPELCVFMVQKEVAERIVSPAGSKEYGALSVMVQYYSKVQLFMNVSHQVFVPRPKVDSSVIVLSPWQNGRRPIDEKLFLSVVKAGFGQRRKMLRNSLDVLGLDREILSHAFEKADIQETARAESLSVNDFITLSDAIGVGQGRTARSKM
jgi:16S rRNA (adenine1518-N6/adenine1519-N6)-dimethyltransferase